MNDQCGRCFTRVFGSWTMSMFNTQTICMACMAAEERHPLYTSACAAESVDLRKTLAAGDPNYFPGIGLPPELRMGMVSLYTYAEWNSELFLHATWGHHDGRFDLLSRGDLYVVDDDAACRICGEFVFSKCETFLRVDFKNICIRCGVFVLERIHADISKFADSAAKTLAKALELSLEAHQR